MTAVYESAQIEPQVLIEIYSKAKKELEDVLVECTKIERERTEAYKKFMKSEDAKWRKYEAKADYLTLRSHDHYLSMTIGHISDVYKYRLHSPATQAFLEATTVLNTVDVSEKVNMSQEQVQRMLKFKNGDVFKEVKEWMEFTPVFCSAFKDEDFEEVKEPEKEEFVEQIAPVVKESTPQVGFWGAFGATLLLILAVLFFIAVV